MTISSSIARWGLLFLLCAGGCASTNASSNVSYRSTAESNYLKGMAELKDESFPDALRYFNFVKNKFPFSRFATLAELRIADTYFAQEKFIESADAYKLFVKFHPTHPQVIDGYAAFRAAESYVRQIPGDWFLLPPGYEKDQVATREAVRELKIFVRTYANSKYLEKGKQLYRQGLRRLAAHELYVARFYLEQGKPKATILRLEGVLQRYPEAGVHPEVMLLLGKTYLSLEKRAEARKTFVELTKKYPQDYHAAKAKLYLRYLGD